MVWIIWIIAEHTSSCKALVSSDKWFADVHTQLGSLARCLERWAGQRTERASEKKTEKHRQICIPEAIKDRKLKKETSKRSAREKAGFWAVMHVIEVELRAQDLSHTPAVSCMIHYGRHMFCSASLMVFCRSGNALGNLRTKSPWDFTARWESLLKVQCHATILIWPWASHLATICL